MRAPIAELFEDDGTFPNSRLPLLIYAAADAPGDVSPEALEVLFAANGWPPAWRYTIYPFHHYHSTAHEVLGIAAGRATLMLGGPRGRAFEVRSGDVIVTPAGVAHRQLAKSADFLVVGGYPIGAASRDLLRGEPGERPAADRRIDAVPLPGTDPVEGKSGALTTLWT